MSIDGDAVFLIKDGRLAELHRAPFELEGDFQEQLALHPQLLGGSQYGVGEARRWLLVMREVPVPDTSGGPGRWSLDHLYVDQDAIPTLVEVKRASDTRLRREVVGQMLDYAANAVRYWPPDRLRAEWEKRLGGNTDPDDVIRDFADETADDFWVRVGENLADGRIRMLFVSDEIPSELQTVIEYLNEQMSKAQVFGVSIARYEGEYEGKKMSMLVPRVAGMPARAAAVKAEALEETYEELLNAAGELAMEVDKRLLELAKQGGFSIRYTPKALNLHVAESGRKLVAFFPKWLSVELHLSPVRNLGQDELADEILHELEGIAGKKLGKKYPGMRIDEILREWDRTEEIIRRLAECG